MNHILRRSSEQKFVPKYQRVLLTKTELVAEIERERWLVEEVE